MNYINKNRTEDSYENSNSGIPFDSNAVKAINNGQTIVDIDCTSGKAVKIMYEKTMKLIFEEGDGSK